MTSKKVLTLFIQKVNLVYCNKIKQLGEPTEMGKDKCSKYSLSAILCRSIQKTALPHIIEAFSTTGQEWSLVLPHSCDILAAIGFFPQ